MYGSWQADFSAKPLTNLPLIKTSSVRLLNLIAAMRFTVKSALIVVYQYWSRRNWLRNQSFSYRFTVWTNLRSMGIFLMMKTVDRDAIGAFQSIRRWMLLYLSPNVINCSLQMLCSWPISSTFLTRNSTLLASKWLIHLIPIVQSVNHRSLVVVPRLQYEINYLTTQPMLGLVNMNRENLSTPDIANIRKIITTKTVNHSESRLILGSCQAKV